MKWSKKLFKVKGIDINIHLTFFMILIWAAYYWRSITGAGLQGALFGIIATLLLFVAVTMHELGHSYQAIRFGVRVKDITLMPLVGLARMEDMPKNANQELRIAIAGPLVSFAIAALLAGVSILLQTQAVVSLSELSASLGTASWSGLLAYMTTANLALGIYNLIPAFPMDGGRALRAWLAMRMDYTHATKIAANFGQGLALLFVLWGIFGGNYYLSMISAFVWMGAKQESKDVQVQDTLRNFKVRQAMTTSPQVLSGSDPLSKAAALTLSTAQVDFPVLGSGSNRVIGILDEGGMLNGLQSYGEKTPVREVMDTEYPVVHPDEPLYQALQQMTKKSLRVVPVVGQENKLAGLLTAEDIDQAYRLLKVSPLAVLSFT